MRTWFSDLTAPLHGLFRGPRAEGRPETVRGREWIPGLRQQLLLALLITAALGIPIYFWEVKYMAWSGIDWQLAYYPAAKLLWHGQNPYVIPNFHNPPWALIPFIPLTWIGETAGGIAVFFCNLFSFVFVAFRLRARLPAVLMLALSPLMVYALYFNNIDWLVLWGLILPPQIGLFFVALKPQAGIGIAIYWAYHAWREGGWRRVAATFAPLTIVFALTFPVFGIWTRETSDHLLTNPWNMTLFPWSLPVGALILYLAIRYKKIAASTSAAPFLSPYLNMGTWTLIYMGLLDNTWLMTIAFVVSWLLFVTQAILVFPH